MGAPNSLTDLPPPRNRIPDILGQLALGSKNQEEQAKVFSQVLRPSQVKSNYSLKLSTVKTIKIFSKF